MRYVTRLGLAPTEEIARSMSWGLMQVMGQVAREHGFTGDFLAQLCDPGQALETGCAVLKSKITAAAGNLDDALSFWNGGSNTAYSQEVMARLPHYAGS